LTQDLKTEIIDVLKSEGAFIKIKIISAVSSRSLSIFLSCMQRVESPISFKAWLGTSMKSYRKRKMLLHRFGLKLPHTSMLLAPPKELIGTRFREHTKRLRNP